MNERLHGVLPERRKKWGWISAGGLLAFVVAFALVLAVYQGSWRQTAIDLMNVAPPVAVFAFCLVCAKRAWGRGVFLFWLLIGLAHASAALAESTWAWYELVARIEAPFPSLADAYWLAYYPLTLAAVLTLARLDRRNLWESIASLLDGLLFGVAAGALVWQLIVVPTLDPEASLLANAVAAGYPSGDVVLLVGLASLAMLPRRKDLPRGVGWLAASFTVNVAADIIYTVQASAGIYETGGWVDVLWPLAYMLAGVGAVTFLAGGNEAHGRLASVHGALLTALSTSRVARVRMVFPYVVVPIVAFLLVRGLLSSNGSEMTRREVAIGSVLALVVLVLARQLLVVMENRRLHQEARSLAERDSVTGLLNVRGMRTRLEQELARCSRSGCRFSLVIMDIDKFKLFNDTYGHAVGDSVLVSVSRLLETGVRKCDTISRYGGDEFLALLPDTGPTRALRVVQRMQAVTREQGFELLGGERIPISISYGIATYPDDGRHLTEILAVVDANLYRSKRRGGDCITTSESGEDESLAAGGVFTVLDGLVTTVDNKDHYTRRHSEEVSTWAVELAGDLGLSDETQRSLRIAGLLHDVGKIGVPDQILRKPGPLTEQEYEAVKQHVALGELIIKEIPNLRDVVSAVGSHHERWDGNGYPRGLKGEDIPILGRLLSVTDAYSAMVSDRPYRKALTAEQARMELRRVSGTQLDPDLVEVFVQRREREADDAATGEAAASVA